MPARITGSTQTVEVQGGNKLVTVKEYHVLSLPSETYFQFRRPKTTAAATIRSVANQFSGRIEAVLANALVTDVVYSQDTTQGGRLQDRMTTYYRSPDGAIEGDVEQPLAEFGPNVTIAEVVNELNAAGAFLG